MATEQEWQKRIELWRDELPRHFFQPLGEVSMSGFTTTEQLTLAEADAGPFVEMPVGTKWGAKWEYGWFKGALVLPPEAAERRIVLRAQIGWESVVYVNGRNAGAIDWGHPAVTLAMRGVPGTRYGIMLEAYAGHGPISIGGGPVPLDRETVPEPPPQQATVGEVTFGLWEEDCYQLWIEVQMLCQMSELLDSESLRVAEIRRALRDFALIVDFEVSREEMLATVRTCRERLRPLFECVNGSTAPELFAFGHAHLDVAWLWPLRETASKCTRTLGTQLALMEEYPEYRFLQSQPHLYWMVKQDYPELYARIKEKVASGQIIADGAMWVESDTNIPGGESLIRQFMYGKRFLREEFGVESELLWLPDVFGYSAALPQIMRGCGVKYFSTHKIYWDYDGGDPFPYTTFTWEGIDGSEVLASLHNDYNSHMTPEALVTRWRERRQKIGLYSRLMPFGWGDGGGGPTRDHLEYARRARDLEGLPKVRLASPTEHFGQLEVRGYPDDRYVGELYFQAHRGVHTSQARTKRGNRKSEVALREAEMWGAVAQALVGFAYPRPDMEGAWRQVLLNQFHDILPGSSIHRVYEEAEAGYVQVIETAEAAASRAVEALADEGDAVTILNSLSWSRTDLVPLPPEVSGAADATGRPLPTQEVEGQVLAEVTVPACGWTSVLPSTAAPPVENEFTVSERLIENDLLRIEFSERGEIVSLFDKAAQRELAAGPCNSFKLYADVPNAFDAWDINSQYALTPVELPEQADFEVVAAGPLVAALRVTRQLHDSTMTQIVSLRRGSRLVQFTTEMDWRERHKLLKVAFPVTVHANEALHEIQFGHIGRPNHYSRQFDADRFEVANHKWTALVEGRRGCAVLNDCKYGVNVLGSSINLTLLKSPLAPDMTADQGRQEFTYGFYSWNGSLADSDLVREAYELNVPARTARGARGERSVFSVDASNVIIETVKPAEDGSCDVIVRLYEAMRTATRCTLTTSLRVDTAHETTMLEGETTALPLTDAGVPLEFRPFEVKTMRLSLAG